MGEAVRACLWCGGVIPEGQLEATSSGRGVCLTCAGKLLVDGTVSIQAIIDQFPVPVMVVDDDVTVSILNKRGREILGGLPEQAARRRGGVLFGCPNAQLPGGCGGTIHCSGCALRRAVNTTFHTGAAQTDIPATLRRGDAQSPSVIDLTITTFMLGNSVMVKIDRGEW